MQEALKRPQKIKKKLRLFITNSFSPANPADQNHQTGSWELRVEGRLLGKPSIKCFSFYLSLSEPEALTSNKNPEAASGKVKRKFSTFFKSLVIELDKDIYGPDNHLVEWHRQSNTQETDGFQVKRQGNARTAFQRIMRIFRRPGCKMHDDVYVKSRASSIQGSNQRNPPQSS